MALAFLFPVPDLHPPTYDPSDSSTSYFNGDFKTWDIPTGKPGVFTSRQVFKAGSKHTGIGPTSTATPPYHYHYYQGEEFAVQSGTLCYKIDGKEGKLQAGEKVFIKPYRKHTFWNDPSTNSDLDVHITVSGEVLDGHDGFSDDFVHNFYGYLSSRTLSNSSPNPFQMLLFLHSADVALADVPFCYWLAPVVNFVIGKVVGQWIMGFRSSYKVFDQKSN